MAKQEQDREDLLRDGHQMSIRGETIINGIVVTIGFRSLGQLSMYCGADPVFQFNADHQLRRVFFEGERFAADAGRLVLLQRPTRGGKVQFQAIDVPSSKQDAIFTSLDHWAAELRLTAANEAAVWRVADEQNDVFIRQLRNWLTKLPVSIDIAANPAV